ncbi:MAG: amidohydrolase family protein [Candidatus Latescibacteria bacterium]|nr:amidohydrolase family protein [Candidatus Latescibacterota bacterium]
MIIDTHLHIWSEDAQRYPFAEGRSGGAGGSVEFLNETMAAAGVDKAVIVQPIHYLFDNSYVADSLRRFPGRFAAIGLVDPKAPDAPDQLEKLVRQDGFGGLRIHSSRLDHPSQWAAADQDPLWRRSEELGTCFIVHGPAANLPHLEPIIGRFPQVPVVLDHIGGAPTDEEPPYPLLSHVLDLARFPNVYVKLTPQAHKSSEAFPHADTFAAFQRIYDAFGPERLMWGTNFPGVVKGVGYGPALEMFRDHVGFLTADDKEWLFHRTAERVWTFA